MSDRKNGLTKFQKDLLDQRIDALRWWPPKRWFDLRNQKDGTVTFQLENDQMAEIQGAFVDGVVHIYFFNIEKG